MDLRLFINNIDFTDYIIQPSSSPIDSGFSWEVVQNCIGDDSFSFYLDFGQEVDAGIFRLGEVILESKDFSESPLIEPDTERPDVLAPPLRKIRLFGGIITDAEQPPLSPGGRPYPVIHCRAMDFGWRLRKAVMYAQPDTMPWVFESDVNCILHPANRYENNGVSGWSEIAGYGPPLLSWYHWRPIRSLASLPDVGVIREGGPGNLLMIHRNTVHGLARGWCVIGKPTETVRTAGTIPYLQGSILGEGNPTMQTAANLLDAFAYRSGARWWVSPYGELNYVRPQDLNALDPDSKIRGPFNLTKDKTRFLRGISRKIDFSTLSTITAMLNMNTYARNQEKVEIPNRTGAISQIIGLGEFINRIPIIDSEPNAGTRIGRVVRFRGDPDLGGSAAIVNITEGTFPFSDNPTAGPLTDIKFDANTQTLVAPANSAFTPDEMVVFEPETVLIWGEVYQTVPLVHDQSIEPKNGVFIEPVYLEDASTPWDAFNIIAKVLSRGADIDRVTFYDVGVDDDRDRQLSQLRGKPVTFNSQYLNIKDGKSLELARASTFRLQRLKDELAGTHTNAIVDTSIHGRPSVSYPLNEVFTNVHVVLDTDNQEVAGQAIEVGKYEYETHTMRTIEPIQYIVPKDELLSRMYQVKTHLEHLRDAFLVNARANPDGSIAVPRLFAGAELETTISEINQAWGFQGTPTVYASTPLSLKIWHNLDNQGVSSFDETQLSLTNRELELIEREEELLAQPANYSHYLAKYGNDYTNEGYYCRSLTITPLGATVQKYTIELYRYPPVIMDGIEWAAENFKQIQLNNERRLQDPALPPVTAVIDPANHVNIPVALPEPVEPPSDVTPSPPDPDPC